jgi:hypothetical protein
MVGSQIASLTLGPSFDYNLCYKCLNGSCEAILDIYTSRPFQRYRKHFNARCFDPCNQALSFWESRRTSSSHFWESEFHPHTCFKVGLRQPHLTTNPLPIVIPNTYLTIFQIIALIVVTPTMLLICHLEHWNVLELICLFTLSHNYKNYHGSNFDGTGFKSRILPSNLWTQFARLRGMTNPWLMMPSPCYLR